MNYLVSRTILVILLSLTLNLQTFASPLGSVPQLGAEYLRIIFDMQSDIWATPMTHKNSPVRIVGTELQIPLAHTGDWVFSANISEESLSLSQTEHQLKGKSIFIGNNLQDRSAGFRFSKVNHSGSEFSIVALYASASDEPFLERRNRYLDGAFIYASPKLTEMFRLIIGMNQTDNRGLANGRPFPYLGVQIDKSEFLQIRVGFPFLQFIWKDPGSFKYEAQMTPFGAYIDSERPMALGFLWHARTAFTIRSYLYEERLDSESRLFFQQWTAEGGIRKPISKDTLIEFSLGYSFDRKLYDSDSIYTPRNDKTPLESDFFARLRIGFTIL